LVATISELNGDIQYSVTQLRNFVNSGKTLTDARNVLILGMKFKMKKLFLVVSSTLGRPLLSFINKLTQIDSIYIFYTHKSQYELRINKYRKLDRVSLKIGRICDMLTQDVSQCECDLIQISIISNTFTIGMDELDQSFMYSQIFEEVILELEYTDKAKKKCVVFCHQ
jgi:hypothetical protein